MRIKVAPGRFGKAGVEVGHKDRHEGVGVGLRRDPAQPQLLDQAVLQRAVHPFDTALGLAAVGAQAIDIELVQRAPELGVAVAAGGIGPVDPEHTGLVAIERDRLAVALKVSPCRLEIRKSGFRRREAQRHQPAGSVIDVHQQRAGWCTVLEPGVATLEKTANNNCAHNLSYVKSHACTLAALSLRQGQSASKSRQKFVIRQWQMARAL